MTKAQEKEVLKKISDLIESTGKDSYIRTACAGMIEDAEWNIDEDAAYSWKERAEFAQGQQFKAEAAAEDARENLQRMTKDRDLWKEIADRKSNEIIEACNAMTEQMNRAMTAEDRIEELEVETMKLKARLYDILIGGAKN